MMQCLNLIPIKLKTSDGNIKLQTGAIFKPKNPDSLFSLIAEGKVIPIDVNKLFEFLYKQKLNSLEQIGWDVDLNKLKKDNPQLSCKIDQAENKLNEIWLNEATTIEEFKDALYIWYHLMLEVSKSEQN